MQKISKIIPAAVLLFFSAGVSAQDSTKTKSLDEVVVTGQFKPQSLRNSVYQLKVISNERIRLSGATNMQEVLRTTSGVRFTNDNILGADFSLNGMQGRNVKILLDGMPVLDRFDQRASLNQIDVNSIDHIEIVEGPMAVVYGTDAMAGVINIITKKNYVHTLTVNAKAQEETAGDEYYPFSYKGAHTQNLNVHYKKGHWDFNAGGTHNDHNGFGGDAIFGRSKTWLPKEQWLGNGMVGYSKPGMNIYYRVDGMKETITDRNALNIDPDPTLPAVTSFDQTFSTIRFMHQLQGIFTLNKKLSLASSASFTNYKRTTETLLHDFIAGTVTKGAGDGQQDVSKLQSFTIRNSVQYAISDKISLQPGLDINYEKADGARIEGSPDITDYALFVSSEIKITPKINIRPGLRFEQNSRYDAPPVIPSLNTKFILNKNLDLRLAYGYGFRAPVLRELYFIFVDANHNIFGNKDLEAENSNSFNGSLTWRAPGKKHFEFSSTLGSFYHTYQNQIILAQDVNDPARYSYFNVDRTKNTGFTLDNTLSIKHAQFSLGFNYTGLGQQYDAATYKNDSRDLLWTPEVNASAIYTWPKYKTSFALYYKYIGVKPAFSYESNVAQPGIYVTKTLDYSLADFSISTKLHKYVTLNAGVKNIFDVKNISNTSVNTSSVAHDSAGSLAVDYGRSYFLGLAINFFKH